ncbi:MAG: hypothetical protein LBS15_00640 [Endomicrobium sp.]|nr:hypothetical protein [Endomicrobium sp.]
MKEFESDECSAKVDGIDNEGYYDCDVGFSCSDASSCCDAAAAYYKFKMMFEKFFEC